MADKMIFVQYCPNDMWTGCSTLTGKSELAYRRIIELIYINSNQLLDDEVIWEQATRPFYDDIDKIKSELKKKNKIYLQDGYIRNKRCDLEIEKAKDKHQKAKQSAEARWSNANASQSHMRSQCERNANTLTHEHTNTPTINQKPNIYTQEFDIFWRKYVLDENDRRSTKYDSYKQWQKLKDEHKQSLGDRFLTYRSQKGEFYKALERFISKKIYLEIVPEKKMSEKDMKEWKFNSDVDMRKKGIKPLSWSVGYIRELDKAIEGGS